MSEHTPTPWELSAENPRLIMKDVPGMSDGFEQYCVAEAHYHGLLGHKESQTNAAFIVKAVNQYQSMKDVLVDVWFHFSDTTDPTLRKIADAARGLLDDVGTQGGDK